MTALTRTELTIADLTFVGEPFHAWRLALGPRRPPSLKTFLREIHDAMTAAHASALDTQVALTALMMRGSETS